MPVSFSINNGLLSPATQISSPNFDVRPPDANVELLVIHCISLPPGQYGSNAIEKFFTNQLVVSEHPYFREIAELKVSAHLLIRRDAEVVQFVNFAHRAWHAGASCFNGREACNDFSIGIELEGTDDTEFTQSQYEILSGISAVLLASYPHLTEKNIVGHEHIAPQRKTDPGPGFDWQLYHQLLGNARARI